MILGLYVRNSLVPNQNPIDSDFCNAAYLTFKKLDEAVCQEEHGFDSQYWEKPSHKRV